MEKNPQIAVISPVEDTGRYIGMHKAGVEWHPVATTDYLSLLIRGSVVDKLGFLNPVFEYSYGGIHEYSYKVYQNEWLIAYCDAAKMHHFGSTTYGGEGVVKRKVYQTRAREFARKYFIKHYGKDWDDKFASVLPSGVINNYKLHRQNWEVRHRYWVLYRQFLRYKDMLFKAPINWLRQKMFGYRFRNVTPLKFQTLLPSRVNLTLSTILFTKGKSNGISRGGTSSPFFFRW